MNNEQLIHQNFETLHEYLFNALEKGDYYVANKLASFCELHLSNNDSDNPLVSQFYAISMILRIIYDDHLDARMLWKRAPVQLKASLPPTDFALLYQVIIALKDKKLNEAYAILKTTPWQPYLMQHTIYARKIIQYRQLCLISKAFSTVLISTLSDLLDIDNDEVLQRIKTYNWQVDEATNSIKITSAISDDDYQAKLEDETLMILQLTNYISHFEQKPIKVDFNSKS